MANIIESANSAYEERDKANEQIQNLKQQAKREELDFQKDLKEMSQIMEKNKKTLEYIRLTEKQREESTLNTELEQEKKRFKDQAYDSLFFGRLMLCI